MIVIDFFFGVFEYLLGVGCRVFRGFEVRDCEVCEVRFVGFEEVLDSEDIEVFSRMFIEWV